MIEPAAIVSFAADIALAVLAAAFLVTAWRIVSGPALPDRVVGLDTLTGIAIGFIAVVAVKSGFTLYIDIAIALGLVGFLATVAFARFVLSRGPARQAESAGFKSRKRKSKSKTAKPGRGR